MTATLEIFTGTGSAIDNYKSKKETPAAVKPKKAKHWGAFDKKNAQHKNVLSLCRQAQWVKEHPKYGEVADIDRLAQFLESDKSPVKKPLTDMEPQEVSKIIIALKGIVKHIYK